MTDVTRPISQKVSVADPGDPSHVIKPTAAGAVPTVSGSGQPISPTAGVGNLVSLSGATDTDGSLSFSANAQYAIIDTQGFEGAAFTVSGFGTATLAVQWSNLAASGFVAGTISTIGTTTTATTITANGQYTAAAGGRYMKILVTAFTTGPIVVTPVLIAGSSVGSSSSGGGGVTQIQDGTASGNAAVKAASTAPIATDPALVVAISPNGQNANGQATMANSTPVVIASDQTTVSVTPKPTTMTRGIISTAMTGTTSTAVTGMGAAGASVYNYITQITVANTHATVGTNIELQDGNGGTTFYIIPAAALYGGAALSFPTPLKQPTANTALYAKNSTTGSSTFLSASGFTGT